MKIHDEIDDWSAGALCGALSPEERQQFERHLADCPRCRSLHEEDGKMNETLKEAMAGVRPDANFERRMIDGFRGKIARSWWNPWGEFHPLRGLAWLMRFRVAQAAAALILLTAMIGAGAVISGEGLPWWKTGVAQAFPDMKAVPKGNLGANGNFLIIAASGTNGTGSSAVFSGSLSDTRVTTGANQNYWANSGQATWNGMNGNNSWTTGANWGDTNFASVGDTATFADSSTGTLSVNGNASTITSLGSYGGNGDYGSHGGTLRATNTAGLGFGGTTFATGSAPVIRNGNASPAQDIAFSGGGVLQLGNVNTVGTTVGSGATIVNGGVLNVNQTASGNYAGVIRDGSGGSALQNYQNTGVDSSITGVLATNGNTGGSLNVLQNRVITASGTNFAIAHAGNVTSGTGTITNGFGTLAISGTPATHNTYRDATMLGGATIDTNGVTITGGNPAWTPTPEQLTGSGTVPRTGLPVGAAPEAALQQVPPPIIDTRKLIRNATDYFEVADFEKALNAIRLICNQEQGYVFTQNSEKGANGKLQGTVVVKVVPGNLDRLLLLLRGLGELKNETVSAQDVTKDYTDTESRIRNSEITEQRMIDMLKKRTGDISDILEVEKEIANVRGEIEQMQGQLRVYDSLVQFATVTITLQEKDIDQTAAYLLTEQAQLSVFAKDVEKAFDEAKQDASDAKAQTLDSHIQREEDGREVATLHLLLPPEVAEMTILKLKAIGRVQNFNAQTQRVARNGTAPSDTAKVDHDKVEFNMVIQHDAENAVQGTNIGIQTDQVEEKTKEIKKTAADEGVEVKGAEFNRAQDGAEVSAMLLRMPMNKYPVFIDQIRALGKVKNFTVSRREDSTATDDAPAEIYLQIFSQSNIVTPETGATARNSIGEGVSALVWSLRMIGVSLAFIAPWAVIAGIVGWIVVKRRRHLARKQG